MPEVSGREDGGYRAAGVWDYDRVRVAVQCDHSPGRFVAAAAQSCDVARVRGGREGEAGNREADASAEGSVAFVRPFRGPARDCGATRGYVQRGYSAGGVSAGIARRIRRSGAAGSPEPAADRAWRGGVSRKDSPLGGSVEGKGLEAHQAAVQGGFGAAQRHSVHERTCSMVAAEVPEAVQVGRPDRGHVARRIRRSRRARCGRAHLQYAHPLPHACRRCLGAN